MQSGTLDHQQRLSQRMRESWENGQFWANYAARKSWAFDAVFWSWINVKYFGEGDWFEDRIKLEIFLPSDGDELEGAGSGAS